MDPCASILPSDLQHPNKLLLHNGSGHPLNFLPLAADTPSSQHPYLVSLHVSGNLQPSSNGPVAAVVLSGQQPNVLLRHADGFCGLGLHLRGFCSLKMTSSNVCDVDPQISSSVVSEDELDELNSLVLSLSDVDSVENSEVDSVLSVAALLSVASLSLDELTSVEDSDDDSELDDDASVLFDNEIIDFFY